MVLPDVVEMKFIVDDVLGTYVMPATRTKDPPEASPTFKTLLDACVRVPT